MNRRVRTQSIFFITNKGSVLSSYTIRSQTSTVQQLKFENWWVISYCCKRNNSVANKNNNGRPLLFMSMLNVKLRDIHGSNKNNNASPYNDFPKHIPAFPVVSGTSLWPVSRPLLRCNRYQPLQFDLWLLNMYQRCARYKKSGWWEKLILTKSSVIYVWESQGETKRSIDIYCRKTIYLVSVFAFCNHWLSYKYT